VIFDWLIGKRCTAVTAPDDNPANATLFEFEDAVFYVETTWRTSVSGRLYRTRADDGQKYGLERPVDTRADAAELLVGRAIARITVDLLRGDVSVEMEGERLLEFITDSHYEPWQFTAPGQNYFAASGGEVMHIAEESPGRARGAPIRGNA
jgi:hypothetical protein